MKTRARCHPSDALALNIWPWSTVHGMVLLALDGPLRDVLDVLGQCLLDMVERGLRAPADCEAVGQRRS